MKRTAKILAAIGLIIILCVSMTGCMKIDKMRERHGYIDEKGNIVVNGEVFIALPYCEYLAPEIEGYYGSVFQSSDYIVNITDKDVPVLLSGFTGEKCHISKDEMYLVREVFDEYHGYYGEQYYCHEDIYDKIYSAIEAGYSPDGYKYDYTDWSDEDNNWDKEYILTDAQVNAINEVLSTVATMDELPFEVESYDYKYFVEIKSFTEGMPFEKYEMDIYEYESGYYIYKSQWNEDETEWLYDDIYRVPKSLEKTFDEITAKTKEALDIEMQEFESYL